MGCEDKGLIIWGSDVAGVGGGTGVEQSSVIGIRRGRKIEEPPCIERVWESLQRDKANTMVRLKWDR